MGLWTRSRRSHPGDYYPRGPVALRFRPHGEAIHQRLFSDGSQRALRLSLAAATVPRRGRGRPSRRETVDLRQHSQDGGTRSFSTSRRKSVCRCALEHTSPRIKSAHLVKTVAAPQLSGLDADGWDTPPVTRKMSFNMTLLWRGPRAVSWLPLRSQAVCQPRGRTSGYHLAAAMNVPTSVMLFLSAKKLLHIKPHDRLVGLISDPENYTNKGRDRQCFPEPPRGSPRKSKL
jgi:hypothetical protein